MNHFWNFIKKHIHKIVFFAIPIPCLFWLPDGQSLMHGPFYPWPENISTMYGIADYYTYAWLPAGLGTLTTELSGFLFSIISTIFLKFGGSAHVGQLLFFYFGFVGVLSGMYFLARTLNFGKPASIIAGIFYLFSPAVFTGAPIEMVNFKLLPFHIITPIILAVFIRSLKGASFKKELAVFGIVCYLATAAYSSLQYFALHLLLLSIYGVFFIFSKYHKKINIKKIILRLSLLFGVMLLINYFWLSSLMFNLQDSYNSRAEPGFSINHDSNMLAGTSAKIINALKMMPYPSQVGSSPWMAYYYSPIPTIVIFAFLGLIIWSFIDKRTRRAALFPGIWLIVAIFFVKGTEMPFASFSDILFSVHPYFTRLFRNVTYFELLVTPALALLLGLSLNNLVKKTISKFTKWGSIIIIGIMLLIWGKPFITGAPLKPIDDTMVSQYNIVPDYFKESVDFLKNNRGQFRVNSIPSFALQGVFVSYKWDSIYNGVQFIGLHAGKSTYWPLYPQLSGKVDPIMNSVLHPQENVISQEFWKLLLATANVRYITLHHDIAWDLIYRMNIRGITDFSMEGINDFVYKSDAIKKIKTFDKIEIYKLKDEYFLPAFYAPKDIFTFNNANELFSKMNFNSDYKNRPAFYFRDQNMGKMDKLKNLSNDNLPTFEFKKINPTKYRVRAHNANGKFPLVFSESFHDGWRAYSAQVESPKLKVQSNKDDGVESEKLSSYKVLDGNEDDQSSKEELADFIKKGWVTGLGSSKKIDFISKNFQGTIQNDNLPAGRFYETWFASSLKAKSQKSIKSFFSNNGVVELPKENHLMVNGYANSWIIDPSEACKAKSGDSICIKNQDGSYDMEIIVEFWPQKIFYIGIGISGVILLSCIFYLIYYWRRKRKTEERIKN